ncbi:MAG: biotin--[acetyl-CoA-carboxylase] ligase, partial [Alphaproteobacteria bacterium]|nr:biotin--[acetyl-CoA-carboxylase] ligase [Alphaproteobacteria bacterium]
MTYKPQLPPAFNLIELPTVGSTNDHAKQLARSGYPAFTAVWSHEQTAGKGRQGNSWTSVPGNLYLSILLRPAATPAQNGQLSFLAAVALAETVKEMMAKPGMIALKWPNDLLLNGKKAAGI